MPRPSLLRLFRPLPSLFALLALTLSLTAQALPARAELMLAMFRQEGCTYCRQWDREVGPVYPKTEEGKAAPLRELDIHDPLPEDVTVSRRPLFTPTFVLLRDGQEVGRIEGYPGEAFFWGLLDDLLAEAKGD